MYGKSLNAIFLCERIRIDKDEFIHKCQEAGAEVIRHDPLIWILNGVIVAFLKHEVQSVLGKSADMLVGDWCDQDRMAVISRSKHISWTQYVKTPEDLFLIIMRNGDKEL